jgi:hypothetical protein
MGMEATANRPEEVTEMNQPTTDCNVTLGSDEIVELMERHDGDWDETAFNGWGTAACGRWGRYIWQWNDDGSAPEHSGHIEASPEAASEFVREWAAQYIDGSVKTKEG